MSRIPTKDDRLGVQVVAGTDNPGRLLDVVFIHGLAGDAWTTWMSDPDDDSTFWPDWLAEKFPNLGIWTVGYAADPSRWKGESMPIADQGTNLVNALQLDGIGERPAVFITHSLGGILAKQLLRHAASYGVDRWKRIADSTAGMVFLGTPHSGADIANFVTFVGAALRLNESVKELKAHGSRLRDLHNWFRAYHGDHPFPVRTFCEKRKVRLRLRLFGRLPIKLPKGVLVVNQTSAEPNIAGEVAVPLPEDHISICKPPNRKADMYRGVLALINELTPTISESAAGHATTQNTDPVPTDIGRHDLSRIQRYIPLDLIGREDKLNEIDEAWDKVHQVETPRPHVLTYVALGGEGKTALIAKWAAQLASHGWLGCDAAFAWSFYSQGTRDQGDASADVFLAEALRFFGDPALAKSAAAWDKGKRLAQLVGERRTLLILDGLEPLQYAPTSPTKGELKEGGIVALLSGLAENNAGLCIVTTRYPIPDLNAYRQTAAPEIELKRLSKEAGVHLLQKLGVRKESGTQKQFETLVEDVKGHALTLNLLGKYLADAHAGDIRKRDLVKLAEADATEQGGHAFRVMDVYVDWIEGEGDRGRQAIALLRLMGLFDRAVSADCIMALAESPVIEKLTEALVDLNEPQQNLALTRLEESRLITVERDEAGTLLALDSHPLIREYFAKRLQANQPEAWRAGHKRLYEHLCNATKEGDEPTLEQLQPLYQAVIHGCLAGLQQEACDDVFQDRILKGSDVCYSTKKLGAIGADLGAIACFFDERWERVSSALSEPDRAWLLNQAAFRLQALGRLREAVEPMRAGLNARVEAEDWTNAAISGSNLSELSLNLGDVSEAVGAAEASVDYADRSRDAFQRMTKRTRLADSLHQSGRADDARTRFAEAEQMQAEAQPEYPRLYAVQGFQYCDLLLAPRERLVWQARFPNTPHLDATDPATTLDDIEQRAGQSLQLMIEIRAPLLDMALDHLTLARVTLYRTRLEQTTLPDPSDPESHIARGVSGFRKAGTSHHLPRCLLTLAWYCHDHGDEAGARAALDEAEAIAARGPMPLHLADIHLHRARLFADRAELDQARALIQKHGYNRRLPELHDAEAALPAG